MRTLAVFAAVLCVVVAHATLDDWKSALVEGDTPTLTGILTRLKQHLDQQHPWLPLRSDKGAQAEGIKLNDDPPGPEFRWSVSFVFVVVVIF